MTEEAGVELMSTAELERQRAERAAAFVEARKLLWTIESEVEDVLVVADWLLTGRATLALEFSEQTARNYRQGVDREAPDAATWTAGGSDEFVAEMERTRSEAGPS